ncbi:vesicle-associated protein 1-1-like [Phalaenopsis equestris]|uniref:vesicle-associated protein 1-1-like n=1 Tax=Phalaenopsis equestris TaxID=78828 RepID=UPI0009E53E1E|nr:vesicle-associated protein 1-1-like [Phalaenopsis equestris]
MSATDLLGIEPLELQFPFELKKQISCSLHLTNKTNDYIAFKVKTTSPKKYCVRPNTGIVLPRSTCDVVVTMQAQREAPSDMQSKDKFLVQSVIVNQGAALKDITAEMFSKDSGHIVDEVKLRVVYVSPPQPPSPVPEGSEEGSSPRPSVSDNGHITSSEFAAVNTTRTAGFEPKERSSEASDLLSKLTDEKNLAVQQNAKLRQELELLKRELSKKQGGFSFIVVLAIALLGIILGYLFKS